MEATTIIRDAIDKHGDDLKQINEKIHANPELGYNEIQAHSNITNLLTTLGYTVTPSAYNLPTAFSAEYGTGGRLVTYNAEYDALPDIGHACGHNLIATSSIGAFLGLASALRSSQVPGRVRLLGTPAEEGGGGKLKLIDAGAYDDVDACMMVHPYQRDTSDGYVGSAYSTTLANHKFKIRYTGKPSHAAMAPWEGVNALDAVVLAYNAISVLRQQIKPYERINGVIESGGTRPNIITASAGLVYYIRSATLKEADELKARAIKCFEGAAMATGCTVEYEEINTYADTRPNKTICSQYAAAMADLDSPVECDFKHIENAPGSTDMGNVTYTCPGFHGWYSITSTHSNHTPGFTSAAATQPAHDLTIITAKAMATAGWNILTDDEVAKQVRKDWEEDENIQVVRRGGEGREK
ncbi:Peptidase dimerization domain protein [Rutstroemia sp. NJR-2017a WRK4]|nr:Peptidase dimerization domain protein [Rutstroemia sp. NJR-2017a WRK4]